MDALQHAFATLVLWTVGMIAAVFAWRALYRIYTRWKNERDAAEAVARVEEQRRRTFEKLHRD